MRPGCGISTTHARPQRFGVTAHTAAHGSARPRSQRSGGTTPRERDLSFRLSYLRLYEDEIRSVEGNRPRGLLLRFRTGRLDQFAPEIAFSQLLGYIHQSRPKDGQEYNDEETDGEGDDPELHRVELL